MSFFVMVIMSFFVMVIMSFFVMVIMSLFTVVVVMTAFFKLYWKNIFSNFC
jgi:hypothetical protein